MHIKVGMKFKAIDGIGKGREFTVLSADSQTVAYRSVDSGTIYSANRKHFEKYIQRVNKHWHDTTEAYKRKKQEL